MVILPNLAMTTIKIPTSPSKPEARSLKNTILSGLFIVGSLSTVAKIATIGTALLIASMFGSSDDLEAYIIAYLIPSLLINVIAGSIPPAVIPAYVDVREKQGFHQAFILLSNVTIFATGALLAAVALFAGSSTYLLPLLGSGFGDGKLTLTTRLYYVLLPLIPIKGLATICASILNANQRFSAAALAPIMVPLATVAVLLLWHDNLGVYALGVGAIIGTLGEVTWLRLAMGRQGLISIRRWRETSPAVRRVIGQYMPMVAGALLINGAWLVDQAMAASLASGSVAWLNYGNRFVSVIVYIASGTIGTVMFPVFAKLSATRDWTELKRVLMVCAGWTLVPAVAISVLLLLSSETLVGIALERGMFGKADTAQVGTIQAIYGLQIPFQVCGILFVRVISSLGANHVLMVGAVISLLVNVMLNYFLMRIWGVMGIAASTVMVYVVSSIFVTVAARRLLARRICDCES